MGIKSGICARCDGPHSGNHLSYCIQCWRDYQLDQRSGRLGTPQPRACVECGKVFTPNQNDRNGKTKCCSVLCNDVYQRKVKTPAQLRSYHLRTLYGITVGDYERMLAEQGGGCAICSSSGTSKRNGRLHIDHDHDSGRIRGLLCSKCNSGIGQLQDDPTLLRAAAEYIERASALVH